MRGTSQRKRVTTARATEVTGNGHRQAAAARIDAIVKLNESGTLAALKTAVTNLSTALNSDTR